MYFATPQNKRWRIIWNDGCFNFVKFVKASKHVYPVLLWWQDHVTLVRLQEFDTLICFLLYVLTHYVHSSVFLSPQVVSTTWSNPLSWPMMRQSGHAKKMVLKLPRLARCMLPGSCWAMTAVMQAGWRMAVSVTPSPTRAGAAVPLKLLLGSVASLTRSISCMECIVSRATTEPQHTSSKQLHTLTCINTYNNEHNNWEKENREKSTFKLW